MKFVIVIATLVACGIAAPNPPNTSYVRPSPINPSVLSDSKPADKTTLITDPKEVNKLKAENSKPSVLPKEIHHHVSKRDHKPGHDSHQAAKPKAPEPPKKSTPPQPPKKSVLKPNPSPAAKLPVPKRNRRNVQTKDNVAAIALQKPQTLPAVIHKDGAKDVHAAQHPKTLVAHHEHNVPAVALQKPQTLPAITHENQHHKRDIPVPLVANHKLAEIPSKIGSSKEDSKVDNGEVKNDKKEDHKQLVTPHNDNVQVEDLSEPKPVIKHTSSSAKHPHEIHPNKHPISEEQKPVALGDIQPKSNAAESTASTDEHPLIRPKPVPVSELFSRHHDN